jgi:hypothetical protein
MVREVELIVIPSLTSGFSSRCIIVGMDGPYMSASSKPTLSLNSFASATAMLTATKQVSGASEAADLDLV